MSNVLTEGEEVEIEVIGDDDGVWEIAGVVIAASEVGVRIDVAWMVFGKDNAVTDAMDREVVIPWHRIRLVDVKDPGVITGRRRK